jgi:hypothetical protein
MPKTTRDGRTIEITPLRRDGVWAIEIETAARQGRAPEED